MTSGFPAPPRVDDITGTMSYPEMALTLARLLRAERHPEAVDRAAASRALEVAELARRTVPFYRDLYGDRPFRSLADVPMTDKAAMLRVPLQDLRAGPLPEGTHLQATSGTSGQPFEVAYPPRFARWLGLMRIRADMARRVFPWTLRTTVGFAQNARRRRGPARWWAGRRRHLRLDLPRDVLVEHLTAQAPAMVTSHPHRLLDLGSLMAPATRPRRISTFGETIDSALRAQLATVYGAEPLDFYGTAEAGRVAWQCSATDLYHLERESVFVEILDDDGAPVVPGGTGEVVVTGLCNPLQPMVRFRQLDRATLADRPCACGRRGRALVAVVGRSFDFVTGAAGERISPELLWLSLHMDAELLARYVRRYQVRQVASGAVELRVEAHETIPEEVASPVVASLGRAVAGQPVSLHVVDDLGSGDPGKFRLIGSDLASP